MDDWLRHYTAEEIQAALGDAPFVVRGLWPEEPAAAAPTPVPAPPERSGGVLPAAPFVPLKTAARGPSTPPDADPVATVEARGTGPRRWPLVLLLSAASLAAGGIGTWLIPPASLPPPGAAAVPDTPAPLVLPADASAPPFAPSPAPAAAFHPAAAVDAARPDAAEAAAPTGSPEAAGEAPVPAPAASAPAALEPAAAAAPAPTPSAEASAAPDPSAGAASDLAPSAEVPAAPDSSAATPPAVPDAPRPSDPVLAAALIRRAEDTLARNDIAAARALFVRAASVDAWSVEALVGAGKTYDPGFLHPRGVAGGLADPAEARRWYGRASRLGDPTAAILAEQLDDGR